MTGAPRPRSERYGSGATAPRVYGAIAGRMWLGAPGDSELVSYTKGVQIPRTREEMDEEARQEAPLIIRELWTQVMQKTGLAYTEAQVAERAEWLWGTVEDGLTLESVRLFAGGHLEGRRQKPQEMTLEDIKALAERWKKGFGRSL